MICHCGGLTATHDYVTAGNILQSREQCPKCGRVHNFPDQPFVKTKLCDMDYEEFKKTFEAIP